MQLGKYAATPNQNPLLQIPTFGLLYVYPLITYPKNPCPPSWLPYVVPNPGTGPASISSKFK